MKKVINFLLAFALIFALSPVSFAQMGGGGMSYPNYMKTCGTDGLCPVSHFDELGTSGSRWAKIYVTDLDVSGVFTFGGAMGSSLDMDGYDLILDTDGDTKITNDRDVGVADDEFDITINSSVDFTFLADTFSVVDGSSVDVEDGQVTVQVDDNTNKVALTLDNDDVTNNPNTLTIANAGTGLDIGKDAGLLKIGGFNDTDNEDLTLDFETVSNAVGVSSGTGVVDMTWTGIDLNTTTEVNAEHIISTDDADINDNLTVGDITIDEATGVLQCSGATSCSILTDSDVLTLGGVNGALNSENLTLDFETTADTIELGTGTGVTSVDFNSLGVTSGGTISGGTLTDGTLSSTAGAVTGLVSLTDGTATWASSNLSGFGTIGATGAITGDSLNLTANSAQIVLDSDDGGGVTTTLQDSATSARTITFPDASGTVGLLSTTAPIDATYITQTANGTLTNEQAMGALATGLVKNTTTTGVQSIAVADTDFQQVVTWGDGLEYAGPTASVDYNTTNLKITSTELNTIQDIDSTASPAFTGLTLSGLNTANGVVQTDGSGVLSTSLTPSGLTSLTATTLLGSLDTNVASAGATFGGVTIGTDGSDANIPFHFDLKGTSGSAYLDIYDDNLAGYLALGDTSNTSGDGSRLSIVDGGSDNGAGELVLYEDDGNGSFLWVNTASVLRGANSAPADDDAGGFPIMDLSTGAIDATTLEGTDFGTLTDGNYCTYDSASTEIDCNSVATGATTALDNLSAVAINTSLLSDTADTDDLGSTDKEWLNLYIGDAGKAYFGLGQDTSINRSGANALLLTASGGVTTSDSLTLGDNSDENYTITFDSDTNDGVIEWDEDNDKFLMDNITATTFVGNLTGTADSANDVEGTDLGTLTDTKYCVYDLANTEIDCNAEAGTTFIGLSDTPAGFVDNNAIYRVNNAGDAVEESPYNITGYDLIAYEAVNDGSPEFRLGGADAEELHIQTVYDGGAQTLDYVEFITDVASATADKGKYVFDVDGTDILQIDDGGLEILSGNVTGNVTGALTGNASTATALAGDPTDCGANEFAQSIVASGNLTCASIADADVPNDITIDDCSAVEGTDLGTLTDTKFCVYDLAGTEIDCNADPSVAYDSIGDPTGAGSISFDDTETATYSFAQNTAGNAFTIIDTVADVGNEVHLLSLEYNDDADADADFIIARDDVDGTPTTLFEVEYDGEVTAVSYSIGANELTTTEWAFLDGLNQSVATTSDVSFTDVGVLNQLYFSPSGDEARLDDSAITCADSLNRVVGDGGAVVLDTAPAIADGAYDGQLCMIQGTDDTNTVQVADNVNVQLAGGVAFTLGKGDTLTVVWDSGDSDWYEISRSDN